MSARSRTPRPRLGPLAWCLVVVTLAAGVATVPVHARAGLVARAQRAEAASELAAAERHEGALHRTVVHETQAVDRARWELAVQTAAAVSLERRTDDHVAARQAVEEALVTAQAELADTSESLSWMRAVLGVQEHAVDTLRTCLTGVRRANRALGTGDGAGASSALRDATAACREARAGSRPPALPYDFPDPHVVRGPDGRWWAYATNSTAGAVQLVSSTDLTTWQLEGNALASLPGWARPGATWAPAVVHHGGRWLLYYTVREHRSGLQCVSVATGSSPSGPFHDRTSAPVVCERSEGGSIDPNPVVDTDGRLYLLWKTELDTRGRPAELRGAPVAPGGVAPAGRPVTLLRAAERWEGRTIEGPAMTVDGGYRLLYSGGSWNEASYGVGAARCESVLGPCVRQSHEPVLRSVDDLTGPGGLSVFADGSGYGVAYHAWQGDAVGYPRSRYLHIGDLRVSAGRLDLRP